MSDQTQEIKVYELAKELGMDSFALLDKLKENGIEVKNHMSSLRAEQMQTIRSFFQQQKTSTKTAGVVRKKTSSSAVASSASAGASANGMAVSATTSNATPTKRSTKKSTAAAAASAVAASATAATKPAAKKVIKRRSGPDGAETEAAPAPTTAPEITTEYTTQESATSAQEVMPIAAPSASEIAAARAVAVAKEVESLSRPNAPGTKASLKTPNNRIVEKDELLDEFVSRKLKIVKQAPVGGAKEESTYKGGDADKKKVFSKTTEGSSEMFQPFTSVLSAKEEESRKGRSGFAERKTEEIKISDFRKRELVFQPKRKKLPPGKTIKQTQITTPGAQKRKIRIEDKIIVSDLAQRMGEKNKDILAKLINLGVMTGLNQTVDFDTAALIATEFGFEVENVAFKEDSILGAGINGTENLVPRPPVITVMGHVDHGKTSLLDAIRNANVAAGEAGGITQHIGAYSVLVDGKPITFLDTPGHEAFANMRARGANLTDIVVLVVAADDSIMPQTKEAIEHALAAKVIIIVAANKMDKPDANIERLKKDLSQHNLLVEDWGGQIPLVPISALKKTGIKELLETIALQAEVLELKANPDRNAEGVVLEARMEKGRGIVTDILVKAGTLHVGDYIVTGQTYGRVRAMINDKGAAIKEAGPAFPAEVVGLAEIPSAGDIFYVTPTEEDAKKVAEARKAKIAEQKSIDLAPKAMTLDELMSKIPVAGMKELNVLIKADVYGSTEAIRESIGKITSDKVKTKIIGCTVGVITENDVLMAKASKAIIYGFNAKPDSKAREAAKREHVEVKHFSIIYELLDDVRTSMENLLEPLKKEIYLGKAEVKQTFSVSKIGTIAGCVVSDGKVQRNAYGRVVRGKDMIVEGKIVSLKRFKDDASETIKGQECGIGIQNFANYLPGDTIEVFHVEFIKQTL